MSEDKGPVEIAPGITEDSRVHFGKPVIKGTRVDVATVLGHLAAGESIEEIMSEYHVTRTVCWRQLATQPRW